MGIPIHKLYDFPNLFCESKSKGAMKVNLAVIFLLNVNRASPQCAENELVTRYALDLADQKIQVYTSAKCSIRKGKNMNKALKSAAKMLELTQPEQNKKFKLILSIEL